MSREEVEYPATKASGDGETEVASVAGNRCIVIAWITNTRQKITSRLARRYMPSKIPSCTHLVVLFTSCNRVWRMWEERTFRADHWARAELRRKLWLWVFASPEVRTRIRVYQEFYSSENTFAWHPPSGKEVGTDL